MKIHPNNPPKLKLELSKEFNGMRQVKDFTWELNVRQYILRKVGVWIIDNIQYKITCPDDVNIKYKGNDFTVKDNSVRIIFDPPEFRRYVEIS